MIKPCLFDDLLITKSETVLESEPYIKSVKGKAPLASMKHHFANRKKNTPERQDTFSQYEPDKPETSAIPGKTHEDMIAVGIFGGTFVLSPD